MTAIHRPRPAPASGADDDRESLRARYRRVRDLTEALAAPLRPEDQVIQSMADVSPTKWHRGHTTWFFETFLLEPNLTGYDAFDPEFRYLFNSYYEAVGPRHPRSQRGLLSRPDRRGGRPLPRARRCRDGEAHRPLRRRRVARRCRRTRRARAAPRAATPRAAADGHQARALQQPGRLALRRGAAGRGSRRATGADARASRAGWSRSGTPIRSPAARAPNFAFDNESPRHKVYLEPFRIADRLVTAGEWLEFMTDDGYGRPELWLSDGWYAVQDHGWDAPMYWRRDGATAGRRSRSAAGARSSRTSRSCT